MKDNEKIDFVLIWVDGNDKQWQKEKNFYAGLPGDDTDERYREWDNLIYWFRGIEKYAPWVNSIYFVTCGHVPIWLNLNHPKLKFVKHSDYIPEEYLPTFNSHTIELNLHRIKGLSEQFVYFNDDMFLGKTVKPTDFFREGIPLSLGVLSPVMQVNKNDLGGVILNNVGVINEHFNKRLQIKQARNKWFNLKYGKEMIKNICLMPWRHYTGFYESHVPSNFLKSTFQEVWKQEEELLGTVSSHKFRNKKEDVSQWLFKNWQLASNNFYPAKAKDGAYFDLSRQSEAAIKSIKNNKYKYFCINDTEGIENFEEIKVEIINAFQKILPEKSEFEK